MKSRLSNWLTTTIGAVLMLVAIGMYIVGKFKPEMEVEKCS